MILQSQSIHMTGLRSSSIVDSNDDILILDICFYQRIDEYVHLCKHNSQGLQISQVKIVIYHLLLSWSFVAGLQSIQSQSEYCISNSSVTVVILTTAGFWSQNHQRQLLVQLLRKKVKSQRTSSVQLRIGTSVRYANEK